jgi:hypothetical protein
MPRVRRALEIRQLVIRPRFVHAVSEHVQAECQFSRYKKEVVGLHLKNSHETRVEVACVVALVQFRLIPRS